MGQVPKYQEKGYGVGARLAWDPFRGAEEPEQEISTRTDGPTAASNNFKMENQKGPSWRLTTVRSPKKSKRRAKEKKTNVRRRSGSEERKRTATNAILTSSFLLFPFW